MSTVKASPDRTRSILYVVAGAVSGVLWPLLGVAVCAILAFATKDRATRVVLIVLAVAWLLFATIFTTFLGSSSGVTTGS